MAHGKPQRRTLVKALSDLVDKVNSQVFNSLSAEEIDRYKPLLLATNAAERLLDRERQHARAEEQKNAGAERKQD